MSFPENAEEKMGMMDMMDRMSNVGKEKMMGKTMGKIIDDMTADDKKKMMGEMMPKMMEGINMMEMMPKMMMNMMGGGEGKGGMMEMMVGMMPQCLTMMLPNMPGENRRDFVLIMITTLVEQGCAGMSEEERKGYVEMVVEQARTFV